MEDIRIDAVCTFNDGEAFVFNRNPVFKYQPVGDDGGLVAYDGPFASAYSYSVVHSGPKAFGGRKFDIPMKDGTYLVKNTWVEYKGSSIAASGQYWHSGLKGLQSITYNTLDTLMDCYVFYSGMADPEGIAELRAAYTGCVYPYHDYEKVIKYDADRMKWFKKNSKLERDKRNLINHVKSAHKTIEAMSSEGMMFA